MNPIKKYILIILIALGISGNNVPSNDIIYPEMDKELTTFLTDAGWCWYEDPRAIIQNGKLIVGGISGVSGDIRVAVYDLHNDKVLGETVLDEKFQADDHNSPVFYARPDGSLIAMWTEHGQSNRHYYKISSADNYLEWSDRKIHKHNFKIPEDKPWMGVTYMNLYSLENQGLLYNFFRNGPTYNPTYITSDNNGDSWGEDVHFIADEIGGRQRPYARYMQVNKDLIGVSFTDGHPRVYGNSLYYASFDGLTFYNADGSKIKDITEGPLRTSEAEKVYTGSETLEKPEGYGSVPDASWTCEQEKDADENPFIGYTLYKNTRDIRFRLANWTGTAWNDREIAYAGKGLYVKEDSYTGLMALDPDDPNKVFISSPVDPANGEEKGKHEIYMAELKDADKTGTIRWEQVTYNSKFKNIRPIVLSAEGYKVVLWLGNKPWRNFRDYESDIVGYVLERP